MTSSPVARRVSLLTSGFAPALALLLAAGCSSSDGALPQGAGGSDSGGTTGKGGTTGNGGSTAKGGTTGNGGMTTTGGTSTMGGTLGNGGITGKGGNTGTGGVTVSGGVTGSGGATGKDAGPGSGGAIGTGGRTGTGGATGSGGIPGRDGGLGSGGSGGSTIDGGTSTTTIDCTSIPAMPTGGQSHSGNNRGGTGNLAWEIWSNSGSGTLTTFSTAAFSAGWSGTGDYLGRLGFEWGNGGKTYDAYGTITADVAFKKTGSGGGFSYIGIYGWSTNPCVEFYIVDDSFGTMPFNPYSSSLKQTVTIDGESYKLFSNNTNGTGG